MRSPGIEGELTADGYGLTAGEPAVCGVGQRHRFTAHRRTPGGGVYSRCTRCDRWRYWPPAGAAEGGERPVWWSRDGAL